MNRQLGIDEKTVDDVSKDKPTENKSSTMSVEVIWRGELQRR